jgi:hypothetical protein
MKKILMLTVIAAGITASAADMTKAEYVSKRKASAAKTGKPYDEVALAKNFDKLDLNGDGILTDAEYAEAKAKAAEPKPEK